MTAKYNLRGYVDKLEQELTVLRRQVSSQHRYITELEKQLEPSVVAEIRTELSAQEEENSNE